MLTFHSALQADRMDVDARAHRRSAQRVGGAWWRPFASTQMFLFLGNSVDEARNLSVSIMSDSGKVLRQTSVPLGAHASTKLNVFVSLDTQPGAGATGSFSLRYSGSNESLVAMAGLENITNGFSETISLSEYHPERARNASVHQVVIATPGVMLGQQAPRMQFPQSTRFRPYLILHNTTRAERSVRVAATMTNNGTVVSVSLGSTRLAPGSTKAVDFSQLLEGNALMPDHGSVSRTETFSGNESDLQMEAGSVDQTGNYVLKRVRTSRTGRPHGRSATGRCSAIRTR